MKYSEMFYCLIFHYKIFFTTAVVPQHLQIFFTVKKLEKEIIYKRHYCFHSSYIVKYCIILDNIATSKPCVSLTFYCDGHIKITVS